MLGKLLRQWRRGETAPNPLGAADKAFRQGRIGEALAWYEDALQADAGNDALTLFHYGLCLMRADRHAEAVQVFSRSLAVEPSRHKAEVALAEAALKAGNAGLARSALWRAVRAAPQSGAVWMRLATLEYGAGCAAQAASAFAQAWRAEPNNRVAASNFLYCSAFSSGVDSATLLQHSADWGWHAGVELRGARQPDSAQSASARLRIAYLSPDFRDHPIQFFFMPLLRAHDRSRFEVFCFSDAPGQDAVQRNMRAVSADLGDDHWIDCHGWSDDDLAHRISAEGIDVLVDLAGHTRSNRLVMLSRRCAPLQITALGYPCTTGLPTMDIKVTDELADPPGAEGWYSERLERVPSGFWCFEPPADAPAVLPAAMLPDRPFTFGCFGEPCKISDAVMETWVGVLGRAPGARLLLKLALQPGTGAREAIWSRLSAAGLPMDRVELQGPTLPLPAFLESYHLVDAILDTWPFNGGTTTCLALWMGVPVLTLAGDSLRSRMGASILTRVGLEDWIATTPDEYIAKAVRAACEPTLARDLREKMRGLMAPVTDAHRWTDEFELVCERRLAEVLSGQ